MWTVLYLYKDNKSGQTYPEIHGVYATQQAAHEVVSSMKDPSQYFVRYAHTK